MLDLCNSRMLNPPELGDKQHGAAARLAAHVVVKKAGEAVTEAVENNNGSPMMVVAHSLWEYCDLNPSNERAVALFSILGEGLAGPVFIV